MPQIDTGKIVFFFSKHPVSICFRNRKVSDSYVQWQAILKKSELHLLKASGRDLKWSDLLELFSPIQLLSEEGKKAFPILNTQRKKSPNSA